MASAANTLVLAASSSGGDSGNFLVTPGLGLMIWTLIAFGVTPPGCVAMVSSTARMRRSEAI